MSIDKKIKELQTLSKNLKKFVGESALRHHNFIEDAITEDQLYNQGIDGLGRSLGDYAPFTKEFKRTIAGQLGRDTRVDHITLRDTGDFHNSIKVSLERDGIKINSEPQKDDTNLLDEFGEEILCLTDENLEEFIQQFLKDDLRKDISNAL